MRVEKQRGFTIVELLVVISIIAMLVAILLPAVNMARESARNVKCKSNIRQLATATNSFQTRMRRYPGYRSQLDSKVVSWVVRLFPDFGERALYENWRAAESLDQVPRPSISLLDCPSDPLVRDDGPSLSYMANAGRAEDSPEYNSPEFGVFLDRVPRDYSNAIPQMTSAFLDEHGDGQGKTLLLAENIQLLLPNRQTGTRWDVADNKMSNVFVWHCTNSPTRSMRVNGDPRDRVLSPATARPASNHAGGANVAFCDQVVTFLRDDIDYRVYIQLMAPHDEHIMRDDPDCGEILTQLGPMMPLTSIDIE